VVWWWNGSYIQNWQICRVSLLQDEKTDPADNIDSGSPVHNQDFLIF
jgi:hypothetical protein